MIVVEMNEDIRKKEVKFMGPLTFRQVISIVIGCAYAVPIAIFLPFDIGTKLIVGFILALPAIACGWVKRDGQHFETILIRSIYKRILTPRRRKKKDLCYQRPRQKLKREKEKEFLKSLSPKQRDAYIKAHKHGTVIRYSKSSMNKMYR